MYVHRSVEKECVNFFRKFRRRVYTTPKSYIDLIESYKSLLKIKKDELSYSRNKLSNGIYKLIY